MKNLFRTMFIHLSILKNMKQKPEIQSWDRKETRDVPGVGDDALKDLDERGIIRIGAEVRAGDILWVRLHQRVGRRAYCGRASAPCYFWREDSKRGA